MNNELRIKKKHCVLCNSNKITTLFSQPNGWVIGKCANCGLVQVVPMPSETEIAALYHEDGAHFDPYIEQEVAHREYFRKKIEEIGLKIYDLGFRNKNKTNTFIHLKSYLLNRKLLDIGCLTGVLLDEAKKAGMKAEGVDISHDAVMYCRKKGFTMHEGTVMNATNLHPATFDVVTAFQVIEHERDALLMMKRIYKLLKRGGLVVLATPNYGGVWSKLMGRRWFGFAHPEHVVLFDFKTMKLLLEKAGFKDIVVRKDSPRPFQLSFVFTRGADYFPCLRRQTWAAWLLKPIGKLLDHFDLKNPINPWDDMIAIARK
jgi:2-polyprenyl-3-methyl-5-hydroxy-6-metoxy-1,4-benzoquinol methylase